MLRKITKAVGRYRVGDQPDYPRDVWNKIAVDAGMALDKFTQLVETPSSVLQSSLKGRPVIHRRLGGTA